MKTFILFLGAALMAQSAAFGTEMPVVGDKAPDFSALAVDGKTVQLKVDVDKGPIIFSGGKMVQLKDFLGKGPIILYFYPKDDTKGCTAEACGIRDTMDEFKGLNATVLGVSFDSVESHKAFIEKYHLPFLLLADTDKKIAEAYGVANENSKVASRVTFVIDKNGKIAFVDPKVNPATHAAEIRAALANLAPNLFPPATTIVP